MKLLGVIKNSCILVSVILAVDVCAMDKSVVLREKHRQKHCISRRESRFDFLKLHELGPWYENLSEKQKAKIQNNLEGQDRGNQILFHFITKLPQDIQKLVVAHMFEGYRNLVKESPVYSFDKYTEIVNGFYEIPLCKALNNRCSKTEDIFFNQKSDKCRHFLGWHHLLEKDPSFKIDILFKLIEDIFVFDKWIQNNSMYPVLNKCKVQSINKICETFKQFKDPQGYLVAYKSYESFTIDNFRNSFKREQWCILPFFLAPFISRLIAKEWTYKCFSQTIADSNRERAFVKPFFEKEHQETGDLFWLSRIRPIWDPFEEKIHYPIVVIKSLVYGSCLPVAYIIVAGLTKVKSDLKELVSDGLFSFFAPMRLIAIASFCYAGYPLGLSFILPVLERPFLGIGCVTGLYALLVSLYNVKKMRSVQSAKVSLKDLSELLQRTDIVIE